MKIHQNHNHIHEDDSNSHSQGIFNKLSSIFHLHSHDRRQVISDEAFNSTAEGIRTIWIALVILLTTSIMQIVIVAISSSVSLLADTTHNIGDGLNSIPLLIAFYLARQLPTRRYNYGFGKAEDIAGIFIVLSIAFSAGVVFWESFQRLIDPRPVENLGWVAAAAVIGFMGNEWVAVIQIRVGRRIGSAAMVADGLHARTDGLTSLAVLLAAGGVKLGLPILDPLIGFLIGFTILYITWDAIKAVGYRLIDAVDPKLIDQAEHVISHQFNVKSIHRIRMRWIGHALHAEVQIAIDPTLTVSEGHAIVEKIRHDLFHGIEGLAEIMVHVGPWDDDPKKNHHLTEHHEPVPQLLPAMPTSTVHERCVFDFQKFHPNTGKSAQIRAKHLYMGCFAEISQQIVRAPERVRPTKCIYINMI